MLFYRNKLIIKKYIYLLIIIATTSSLIIGCGTKEIRGRDAEVYLNQGIKHYEDGKYRLAAEMLEDAIKYAETPSVAAKAQLYLGNAYFKDENYLEAIPSYNQFLEYFPDHEEAPMVLYNLAMSHYNEIKTFDREQKTTWDAIEAFEKLKNKYPEFAEKKNVDKYIQGLRDKLAEKELYVANFYFRTGHEKAAVNRLKYIFKHYRDTETYKKALLRYSEYLANNGGDSKDVVRLLNKLLENTKGNEKYAEELINILNELKNKS